MIFHDVIHNTPEWYDLRIGVPTASSFDKIITPKTGKLSSQADGYIDVIIAELIMGQSLTTFKPSYWMERGALMEAEARNLYAFETGYDIDRGGFMTTDDGNIGCSPDLRVFKDGKMIGGAEIKCPAPWTHVANLRSEDIDPQYIPQVQGQVLIGGFEFVDWFSYHPEMPSKLIRTYRDDDYCEKLQSALQEFTQKLDYEIERLKSKGVVFPKKKSVIDDEIPEFNIG